MLAAPINPSDLNMIEGTYHIRPALPAVGGNEGVGVVTAIGPGGAAGLRVGDWVIPAAPGLGTWRTELVCDGRNLQVVRKDVPAEYAATVAVNPVTALCLLNNFVELAAGDAVVQNGANSMVGQCVIQLARDRQIQTINIIRKRQGWEQVEQHLKDLGATAVLTDDVAARPDVKSIQPNLPKAKLGLNCVGGQAASSIMKLLEPGGTMVTYGGMSKKPITSSTSAFIFKPELQDLTLRGFWLSRWSSTRPPTERVQTVNKLLQLVHEGRLTYRMELTPYSNFEEALQKSLGKRGHAEKQVLVL
eukprot:SM000003S11028  [mRNA]  locus=s3:468655:470770:- [translate_table: standard]